jgi:hypothetical protein
LQWNLKRVTGETWILIYHPNFGGINDTKHANSVVAIKEL